VGESQLEQVAVSFAHRTRTHGKPTLRTKVSGCVVLAAFLATVAAIVLGLIWLMK